LEWQLDLLDSYKPQLQLITALYRIHALHSSPYQAQCLLSMLCLHHSLLGKGSQRRRFCVQVLTGWPLSHSPPHGRNSSPLVPSRVSPALATTRFADYTHFRLRTRLSEKSSVLGMYRLHGFSIVVCLVSNNSFIVARTRLQSHCVATDVFSGPRILTLSRHVIIF
jgi:hypothetical protein